MEISTASEARLGTTSLRAAAVSGRCLRTTALCLAAAGYLGGPSAAEWRGKKIDELHLNQKTTTVFLDDPGCYTCYLLLYFIDL